MKRVLLLLVLLIASMTSYSQMTAVPDAAFETRLGFYFNVGPIDGLVPTADLNALLFLNVGSGVAGTIYDLTGIEECTSLALFQCYNQPQIPSVDFSNISTLGYVEISECFNMTSMILGNQPALTDIVIPWNGITSLDVTQCPALERLDASLNPISPIIDVSNCPNLSELTVSGTLIPSLDVTQNPNLTYLSGCGQDGIIDVTQNPLLQLISLSWMPVANLDLTQNPLLTGISVSNTDLISLNTSENPLLETFNCWGTPLKEIDVSDNPLLEVLQCTQTHLTHLDLFNNVNLNNLQAGGGMTELDLSQNTNLETFGYQHHAAVFGNDPTKLLSCIDLNSGTNQLIIGGNIYINALPLNTPVCIQVDNTNGYQAWWGFPTGVTITQSSCACEFGANRIQGKIEIDNDNNCIGEGLIPYTVLKTSDNDYALSDGEGKYTLYADSGNVDVMQFPLTNPLFVQQTCPSSPGVHSMFLNGNGIDTTNWNFANEIALCPLLQTSLVTTGSPLCFINITSVGYSNNGTTDTNNVKVYVDLPPDLEVIGTSQPYVLTPEGYYEFDIGTLNAGESGSILFQDSVVCDLSNLGKTVCVRSWITPENECSYSFNNTSPYDGSEITVGGSCTNDSIIKYVIYNTGSSNMTAPTEYRIYAESVLASVGNVQMATGDSVVLEFVSTKEIYRLEVDQVAGYPTISNPNFIVQSCLLGSNPEIFASIQPNDDGDQDMDNTCMTFIGSWDPNMKEFNPPAIGTINAIPPGTDIDYTLHFQNTGTDTARTVIVTDTVSPFLDLATFQFQSSSHPVDIDIIGNSTPVLKFTFYEIDLPDSTVNEIESKGFVKFSLSPYDSLSIGTEVHNEANIYFDYNPPIITNDAWYTIWDSVPNDIDITVTGLQIGLESFELEGVLIYPNPNDGQFIVQLQSEHMNAEIEVTDMMGHSIQKLIATSEKQPVNLNNVPKGLYLIKIRTEAGMLVKTIVVN